jgi:hypothetical protein
MLEIEVLVEQCYTSLCRSLLCRNLPQVVLVMRRVRVGKERLLYPSRIPYNCV